MTSFREEIGSINHRKPEKVTYTKHLKNDSARRDFTMNAIYYDPVHEKCIDPQNGQKDLAKKQIRFVGKGADRIEEDALRILRYVRMKHRYGLTSRSGDLTLLKKKSSLLKTLPKERIKQELDKIMLLDNVVEALKTLKKIGFFGVWIPEVDVLEKTPGGPSFHLEGNVWKHTLLVIKQLKKAGVHDVNLLYVGLLHDIGKAKTYGQDVEGCMHYYLHEKESDHMFGAITKRLGFDNKAKVYIGNIIRHHVRIGQIPDMRPLKRFSLMQEDFFADLLTFFIADSTGKIPSDWRLAKKMTDYYREYLKKIEKIHLFCGKEIIQENPKLEGKQIGETLRRKNNRILAEIQLPFR